MQTFLPLPDFTQSLHSLDYRRLGKQRVESYQIILAQHDNDYVWSNHPAVKMWSSYLPALVQYYNLSLLIWEERGYSNKKLVPISCHDPIVMPWWFGEDCFHQSHRQSLLHKYPAHYYVQFPDEKPRKAAYYWPDNERRMFYRNVDGFKFDVASYVRKN